MWLRSGGRIRVGIRIRASVGFGGGMLRVRMGGFGGQSFGGGGIAFVLWLFRLVLVLFEIVFEMDRGSG